MKKVSDRLRELRGDRTQAEAAKMLGWPYQTWGKYESGAMEPNAKNIRRICAVFHTTSDWLLGLSNESAGTKPTDAATSRIAELEAENARLRGEIQGLRFALEAVSKGDSRVQVSASHGQDASSAS